MPLVYKAQDILLNRNVAIKVLRQQFVHDEEFIRRFRREAQSAASLSHSNVVSIYDVGQEEDVHYIVMEYIEGPLLLRYVNEKGEEWTPVLISQLLSSLSAIHREGWVFGDLKPENLIVTGPPPQIRCIDVGGTTKEGRAIKEYTEFFDRG